MHILATRDHDTDTYCITHKITYMYVLTHHGYCKHALKIISHTQLHVVPNLSIHAGGKKGIPEVLALHTCTRTHACAPSVLYTV